MWILDSATVPVYKLDDQGGRERRREKKEGKKKKEKKTKKEGGSIYSQLHAGNQQSDNYNYV